MAGKARRDEKTKAANARAIIEDSCFVAIVDAIMAWQMRRNNDGKPRPGRAFLKGSRPFPLALSTVSFYKAAMLAFCQP